MKMKAKFCLTLCVTKYINFINNTHDQYNRFLAHRECLNNIIEHRNMFKSRIWAKSSVFGFYLASGGGRHLSCATTELVTPCASCSCWAWACPGSGQASCPWSRGWGRRRRGRPGSRRWTPTWPSARRRRPPSTGRFWPRRSTGPTPTCCKSSCTASSPRRWTPRPGWPTARGRCPTRRTRCRQPAPPKAPSRKRSRPSRYFYTAKWISLVNGKVLLTGGTKNGSMKGKLFMINTYLLIFGLRESIFNTGFWVFSLNCNLKN